MKFKAKTTNTSVLTFNDLGKDVKGVSPEEKHITLAAGESVYLTEGEGVLYSATAGDAHKYAAANLLEINDTIALANNAELTITHNFGIIPNVTVAKNVAGSWVGALIVTDYTVTTNAAMTQTKVKNVSGGALTFNVRIG